MWQLRGVDPEAFIERYWQKKPCVIRNAFAEFESPVSAEELAGLACEPEVHCRLVMEKGGDHPWQLRYGPFEEQDFRQLPQTHYSLLVSECEKWLPELGGILDCFRFIPDWRIDDLMISYAPDGGSVGPHVDQYDVFLLQAEGQRRWLYDDKPLESVEIIEDLELAILSDFSPQQEVVLEAGDMLYLPPGIPHHGIAVGDCMTYSIGFRAPTSVNALESFAMEVESLEDESMRYRDEDLQSNRHPAEITDQEISRFRQMATQLLESSDFAWQQAIGKLLSDSSVIVEETGEQPVFVSDLLANNWMRHPDTRMLYHIGAEQIVLYYNGRSQVLPKRDEILQRVQQICDTRDWPGSFVRQCIEIPEIEKLIVELANNNAIIPVIND